MLIRSWLFVPGDSERKLEKARGNPADALILDLEDAVADERQAIARDMVKAYLVKRTDRSRQQLWVRVNPLDSDLSLPDLAAVMPGRPDGIVLSKVNAANDVNKLRAYKQNSGVAHRVSHCVSETAITLDLRGHVRCNPRK